MQNANPAIETTLGEKECKSNGLDFAETFVRQFIIAETPIKIPAHWRSVQLGCWMILHCPLLQCQSLVDLQGRTVGVVLGIANQSDGSAVTDGHKLTGRDIDAFERQVEEFSGRFVTLLRCGEKFRLYSDPSSSFVSYFDPVARRIASCLPLLLTRELKPNKNVALDKVLDGTGSYFFFGQTADEACSRLIANHYLDLESFHTVRHWPRDETEFGEPANNGAALEEIMALLTAQMEGLIRSYHCAFPITGGSDSRILIAASRAVLGDVGRFFIHCNNQASRIDSISAVAIAEKLNVPLQILSTSSPRVLAEIEQLDLEKIRAMIRLRCSYQYTPSDRVIAVHEIAPKADLILRGGLVEMTRSNKWKTPGIAITAERGLKALPAPRRLDPDFFNLSLPAYSDWMSTLPALAKQRAVDLGHCEQWLPATANVTYSAWSNHFYINPYNSRRILQLTSQLTYHFRRVGRPQRVIMRRYMRELLNVPYKGQINQRAEEELGAPGKLLRISGR